MEKFKVIEILKEIFKVKKSLMEYYRNNNISSEFLGDYKIRKETEESFYYIRDLINFLRKEDYKNYNGYNNKLYLEYTNLVTEASDEYSVYDYENNLIYTINSSFYLIVFFKNYPI